MPSSFPRLAVVSAVGCLSFAPWIAAVRAGDQPGALGGSVTDPSGAAVPGASVEADGGRNARARTNRRGEWTIVELPAGPYRVVVRRPGFAPFAREGVVVVGGRTTVVDAPLDLGRVRETVNVSESEDRRGALGGGLVLEGALLDALPDDPGEMLAALAALAGAGPGNAPPVLVDGFAGGRVPPKAAIRMIRLNSSPYSAEYDYPGLGRIEIFTKPGGDGLHGHAQARLGGTSLDARDPFASAGLKERHRLAGSGALSGALVPGMASFFLDVERAVAQEPRLVNAVVLGPGGTPLALSEGLVAPLVRTTVSPRLDAQLGTHTVTARYAYAATTDESAGVGGFSLPSRAYASTSRQHLLQVGDTFPTGRFSHEVRAQWSRQSAAQEPASLTPALVVQDAFAAGGADSGPSTRVEDRLEVRDVLAWTAGGHAMRAGVQVRRDSLRDLSRLGWNGTVTFAGGVGPALDASGHAVVDESGQPVLVPLTSLERYRRTLALAALGFSPEEVRDLGGGASLLQVAGGEALATAAAWDVAAFVQDEWKARKDLAVGLGLRVEAQSGLGGLNAAPRASFAWTPGRREAAAPETVVRGGLGFFYERVAGSLFLDARRFDGASPRQFVVDDPAVLDRVVLDPAGGVVAIPAFDTLAARAQRAVVRRLAEDRRAPSTLAGSLSVDRTLGGGLALSVQWSHTATWRALRSRVAAPPTPDGPVVYQYESTGHARQDQLMLGMTRFGRGLSLSARYFLSFAYGDTDGPGSFPASSADPRADWSRASGDVRHRLVLSGSVALPGDVRLSPFVLLSSGSPYDLTIGRDLDGDTIFGERPAYATDPSRPGVVATPYGLLDPAPPAGATIVPRNLGQGPALSTFNVRLSRSFRLGTRGGHGGAGAQPALTVSLYAQNVLDRANAAAPIGNLASPFFGRSLTTTGGAAGALAAGHRSVELQIGTSF